MSIKETNDDFPPLIGNEPQSLPFLPTMLDASINAISLVISWFIAGLFITLLLHLFGIIYVDWVMLGDFLLHMISFND